MKLEEDVSWNPLSTTDDERYAASGRRKARNQDTAPGRRLPSRAPSTLVLVLALLGSLGGGQMRRSAG